MPSPYTCAVAPSTTTSGATASTQRSQCSPRFDAPMRALMSVSEAPKTSWCAQPPSSHATAFSATEASCCMTLSPRKSSLRAPSVRQNDFALHRRSEPGALSHCIESSGSRDALHAQPLPPTGTSARGAAEKKRPEPVSKAARTSEPTSRAQVLSA